MGDEQPCDCGHPAHRISSPDLDTVRDIAISVHYGGSPEHADLLRLLCAEHERQGEELAEALLDVEGWQRQAQSWENAYTVTAEESAEIIGELKAEIARLKSVPTYVTEKIV